MRNIEPKLKLIADVVAADYGISFLKMVKTQRKFSFSRFTYAYLAKKMTSQNRFEIGLLIKRSKHFVSDAQRKVQTKIDWNGDFADKVNRLVVKIEGLVS
ncbi:MAG: hypothetical protein HRU28_00120 [Rhizobiales bacterium]|nr:hypothetical protein [Hyphomicrobiales bacterium]